MAGPNLEIFKFGLYIAFPIAWMYYFGTNLDARFAIPDFWPREQHSHKIPTEREDVQETLRILRERRETNIREKLEEMKSEQSAQVAGATAGDGNVSAGGTKWEDRERNYERKFGDRIGRVREGN